MTRTLKLNILSTALLFFAAGLCFIACQKERSAESKLHQAGNDSIAVFTLVAAGTNCSDANVTGIFQARTTLTAASRLTITVNVAKVGPWTLTTNTVNGFFFAGSGVFASTGSQVLVLLASGIPVAVGNSLFLLEAGTTNCSVSVAVTNGGGTGVQAGDIYYKATIGGTNYTQNVTATNGFEAGSGMGGVDDVSFGAGINFATPPLPLGLTEMGIEKKILHKYLSASDSVFKAFFAPGAYAYNNPGIPNANGVSVDWTDPAGENWSTDAGIFNQTGSTFKIISVTDSYDVFGKYYVKVKMQFSCKLYNTVSGVMKPLVNGEMVALFGKL